MTTPTPDPETFIPAIGRDAKFQPWHGGPCPLCPQEIVTVKTQSGEEHTGLAKNFQWEWMHGYSSRTYPAGRKLGEKNVVGFHSLGSCQKLTGAACHDAKPQGEKMELTPGAWLFIGAVICLALRGAAKLFGVWP